MLWWHTIQIHFLVYSLTIVLAILLHVMTVLGRNQQVISLTWVDSKASCGVTDCRSTLCDFDMWQSQSGDGSSGSLVLFSTMYLIFPCSSNTFSVYEMAKVNILPTWAELLWKVSSGWHANYINYSLNNQNNILCYRRFDFTSEVFITTDFQ